MGIFFSVLIDQATHFSCVLQQFIYVKGFFFINWKEYFAFQTTIGRLIQTAYYNTDYAYGKKRREEKL